MTHPDRQISEEIAEAWRRVHITAWEFEGNIRPTNWTEGGQLRTVEYSGRRRETSCNRESQHPGEQTPRLRLSSHGERERHNADGHNFGVKIFQLCSVSSSLSHANFEQLFRNLQIKWEVNILLKKSSCVVYYCVCLIIIVLLWYGIWAYNKWHILPARASTPALKFAPNSLMR